MSSLPAAPASSIVSLVPGVPLLAASVIFGMLGCGWVMLVLCWQFPWLAKMLFFLSTAALLFGASMGCLVLYIAGAMYRHHGGAAHWWLPSCVSAALNSTVFELLHLANVKIMLPLYDWIRVALLVFAALDEEDRVQIVQELDSDFRRNVFQRPALRLLPEVAQRVLLGPEWEPQPVASDDNEAEIGFRAASTSVRQTLPEKLAEDSLEMPSADLETKRNEAGMDAADARDDATAPRLHRLPSRRSVDDVLQLIRSAEEATRGSMESSAVQRVLTEKISDHAALLIRQGAARQYDTQLSDTVQGAVNRFLAIREQVTSPPQRLMLRVPWELARFSWRVSSSALGVLAPPLTSRTLVPPEEQEEQQKEETSAQLDARKANEKADAHKSDEKKEK